MDVLVVPGEVITREAGHLRGHGTHQAASGAGTGATAPSAPLLASRCGRVDRVSRLISVSPPKYPYTGEVGDVVVGRITEVGSKRWKVDVGGVKAAVLHLSAVNLPGGAQRIRTYADALQMRSFMAEGDLVSAEVQSVLSDGTLSLQTRSLKYGKLVNGVAVQVPCYLIGKLKQHSVALPFGVDCLIGKNGHIWITRSPPPEWRRGDLGDDEAPLAEALQETLRRHAETPIAPAERRRVCQVRNAVLLLRSASMKIHPQAIVQIVDAMDRQQLPAAALLEPHAARQVVEEIQAPRRPAKIRRVEPKDEQPSQP